MKKYSFRGGAIIEAVCSAILIVCMFLPWVQALTLNAISAHEIESSFSMFVYAKGVGAIGFFIYGIVVLSLINIIAKNFRRLRWLSILLIAITIVGVLGISNTFNHGLMQSNKEAFDSLPGVYADWSLNIWTYVLTVLSLIGLIVGVCMPTKYVTVEPGNTNSVPIDPIALPLLRNNFVWMIAAGVLIIVGFILMAGAPSGTDQYNPDIFSNRRIVVGPMLSFLGFVVMALAIVVKPKAK